MGTVIFQSIFSPTIECHCSIDPINLHVDLPKREIEERSEGPKKIETPKLKKPWKYFCSDKEKETFMKNEIWDRPEKCEFESSMMPLLL